MADFNTVTEGNAEGKFYYLNLNVDISSATEQEIEFTDPFGDLLLKTDVTIPNNDLLDPNDLSIVLAKSGQYLAYQWIDTDIQNGMAGVWKAYPRVTINGIKQGSSASACFRVLAKDACC